MKVSEPVQEEWSNIYMLCMQEAVKYQITNRGENLKPLAEVCYMKLKFIVEGSKKLP